MKITTKTEALNIVESSYVASLSSILWVALYYLPIGGALLRLILPLPMILLHLRRGTKTALEGLLIQFLLLFIIMGPVRGTLFLFPLLKCNKIIGRGKINRNKAPPIGK